MRAPESEARERGWLIGGSSRKVGRIWRHRGQTWRGCGAWRGRRGSRAISGDGSFLESAQGGVVSSDTTTRVRAILGSTPEEFRRLQEGNWIGFGAPWVSGKEAYFSQF